MFSDIEIKSLNIFAPKIVDTIVRFVFNVIPIFNNIIVGISFFNIFCGYY